MPFLDKESLIAACAEVAGKVTELRRTMHMQPDLSFQEAATSLLIATQLASDGIETQRVGQTTGIVGIIRGQAPGPVIALRADMDALPIQDEKDVEYRSRVAGALHACGHDAHVAMLLGAASILARHRHRWSGEIRLLFQHAEETPPGGALDFIAGGYLDGVDKIVGMHVWNSLPVGRAWVADGPSMAAVDSFRLTIEGRGGHGAQPEQCVDSVAVGAEVVANLQYIRSRNVDPLRPIVITVGSLHAGTKNNIIADKAELLGTVRTLSSGVREYVRRRIHEVAEGITRAHGATFTLEYERGYPVLVGDPTVAAEVREALRGVLDTDGLVTLDPTMGSEDFAYYLEKVPGTMVFLGSAGTASYAHHHPKFDIDERALMLGVRSWLAVAARLLA